MKTQGDMHVIRHPRVGGDGDIELYGNKHSKGQLVMYTEWTEWGSCSECSEGRKHGERARIGEILAKNHHSVSDNRAYLVTLKTQTII